MLALFGAVGMNTARWLPYYITTLVKISSQLILVTASIASASTQAAILLYSFLFQARKTGLASSLCTSKPDVTFFTICRDDRVYTNCKKEHGYGIVCTTSTLIPPSAVFCFLLPSPSPMTEYPWLRPRYCRYKSHSDLTRSLLPLHYPRLDRFHSHRLHTQPLPFHPHPLDRFHSHPLQVQCSELLVHFCTESSLRVLAPVGPAGGLFAGFPLAEKAEATVSVDFMFNHKYQIRPAFYLDPSALRRRFILCGIAHLVFMPFLLFFVTLYFGLQNAYDY